MPRGTTPRHARGAPSGRRRSGTAAHRAGGAVAALVVAAGLAGGVGAGAAVQALGVAFVPGTAGGGAAAGADTSPERAEALSRSGGRADLAEVTDAAGVVGRVHGDVRPWPVPTLLPPGAPGPVWLTEADRGDGLLSVEVPESGSGVLDVVPGSAPAPGSAPVRTVRVEVEQGLPVDGQAFAAMVMATLNDPRGWGAQGAVTFAWTDGPADVRVVLASPATVDVLCAPLRTEGQVSCGRNGHAALNVRRWVEATAEFTDRHLYRQYLVNHEVGHLLGYPHEDCPGPGQPAPIMQQQSYAVAPCTPNGWPFP